MIFLLGGHDLEMAEIRRIVNECGIECKDHGLEWNNAKLSAYSKILDETNVFVAVELVTDIPLPKNYIPIDHHNENNNENSSIEQVIELLNSRAGIEVKMTRDIQLIAENDKGYIPAMLKIGATTEEVEDIRQRDRKAQGATEDDERLAEESIRNNLKVEEGLIIVESLTPKFSTITDRLFPFDKLLIYTDDELTYYGKGASKLNLLFPKLNFENKIYYGGGKDGYFGTKSNCLDLNELQFVKNTISYTI